MSIDDNLGTWDVGEKPQRAGPRKVPTGPCFVTGHNGFIDFEQQLSSFERISLIFALYPDTWKFTIYDDKGFKWKTCGFQLSHKKPWWLFLPFTIFYIPWISVIYLWNEPEKYSLEELKAAYTEAVDMDDDILTQFVEAKELTKRIAVAVSGIGDSGLEMQRPACPLDEHAIGLVVTLPPVRPAVLRLTYSRGEGKVPDGYQRFWRRPGYEKISAIQQDRPGIVDVSLSLTSWGDPQIRAGVMFLVLTALGHLPIN